MFRDRNEKLNHLVEQYLQNSSTASVGVDEEVEENEEDNLPNKPNNDILRAKIESYCTIMISYMIEDKDLDLKFANKLYEFDSELYFKISNTAIRKFYWQIGFNEALRIVGGVKYFAQAIEGYKTIYNQIKDNLSNYHEYSYNLREKLQQMTSMKDFVKISDKEKSHVSDMTEALEPYSMLQKPVKSKRIRNWAEYYLLLAQLENSYEEEQNKYFSLYRTET